MKTNKNIFILSMPIIMAICSLFVISDIANAAVRTAVRSAPVSRKTISNTRTASSSTEQKTESKDVKQDVKQAEETSAEPEIKEPLIIENKSLQFDDIVSDVLSTDSSKDNAFAELILKQRAAIAASEASSAMNTAQKQALTTNSSSCDIALRKCMMATCGNDFTKCALDGDTIFGDKLNKCKRESDCNGEEFNLFSAEIKADRDMNVRLASYNNVIDCGNTYNACIVKECGTTYSKCLGKTAADAATQKCASVAKECTEADSGLASRFGTAIAKLRENAEIDIKKDDERLHSLRDLMAKQCTFLGATFDERSFDCVYSINFFAGENQSVPLASRKAYAGDTFVCMQEWFGVNATTFKENAYRETRSQTAASSAMLGSGLGTAAGLISSGAIDRALDTQKAKKDLKEECKKIHEEYTALQQSTCSGTVTACNKVEKEKSEKLKTLTEKASTIKCNVTTGRITKKATK